MYVAVGAQRLVSGIGINVAVDRDGHLVQLIGELRKASPKLQQQFRNARRVYRHRLESACELREAARQMDDRHVLTLQPESVRAP